MLSRFQLWVVETEFYAPGIEQGNTRQSHRLLWIKKSKPKIGFPVICPKYWFVCVYLEARRPHTSERRGMLGPRPSSDLKNCRLLCFALFIATGPIDNRQCRETGETTKSLEYGGKLYFQGLWEITWSMRGGKQSRQWSSHRYNNPPAWNIIQKLVKREIKTNLTGNPQQGRRRPWWRWGSPPPSPLSRTPPPATWQINWMLAQSKLQMITMWESIKNYTSHLSI